MKRAALDAIVVTALLAGFGCSGGGGGTTSSTLPAAPASSRPATAKAAFHISIPLPQTGANAKRPAYVSPGTRSVTFSGSGISPQTIALVANAPNCPIDGSGTSYTCTAAFDAPVADITLLVQTYASTDGSGQALSENTVDQTIVGGQDNNVNVTLNGIASTLTLVVTPDSTLTGGTPRSYTATWGAKDASGYTIVGGGSIVDINDVANVLAPTLTSSNPTDLTVGTQTGNSWAVEYDGTDLSAAPPTLTLSQSGYASVVVTFTADPAPTPTPTATPTDTPTPAVTPTPVEAIANGTFATGDLTGWFNCYATHAGYALPVNASPAPQPTHGQASANPTPTPLNVSVQTTTPTGTPPPSGNANFALVGAGMSAASTTNEPKGQSGICQTVSVPAANPSLTFSIFEGGNDAFPSADAEVDVYPSSAWASSTNGALTTSAPTATLMAEDNCYDNLQNNALYLSAPWGSGSHAPTASARYAWCPYTPGGTAPGGGTISLGGYWYQRTFDMSTYANTSITLFFGIWRSAGGGTGTSGSPAYYNYAYFDNIHLTGTGT